MPQRKGHPWLKAALAERGYQQKDVAEAWSCDNAVVSRFINTGEPELTFERASILARMLDMSIQEFQVRIAENLPASRGGFQIPKPSLPARNGETSPTDAILDALRQAVDDAKAVLGPRGGKVRVTITYGNGENG